jgi:hypothetical protein
MEWKSGEGGGRRRGTVVVVEYGGGSCLTDTKEPSGTPAKVPYMYKQSEPGARSSSPPLSAFAPLLFFATTSRPWLGFAQYTTYISLSLILSLFLFLLKSLVCSLLGMRMWLCG